MYILVVFVYTSLWFCYYWLF